MWKEDGEAFHCSERKHAEECFKLLDPKAAGSEEMQEAGSNPSHDANMCEHGAGSYQGMEHQFRCPCAFCCNVGTGVRGWEHERETREAVEGLAVAGDELRQLGSSMCGDFCTQRWEGLEGRLYSEQPCS